jgi:hypothetical protein
MLSNGMDVTWDQYCSQPSPQSSSLITASEGGILLEANREGATGAEDSAKGLKNSVRWMDAKKSPVELGCTGASCSCRRFLSAKAVAGDIVGPRE